MLTAPMRSLLTVAFLSLAGCAHTAQPSSSTPAATSPSAAAQAIVAAPDRLEADRALDAGRHPAALLEFVGVQPGMKVAELMAGGGYTTELLARAVGPTGVVYGENPHVVLERFAENPWSERLARPVNKNVVRVDRELDDPLPPEATHLDAVVSNIIYHDTVWLGTDRAKMNAAIFRALEPGGVYVVLDSSAKPGTGVNDAQTLHRIDEQTVRSEVLAAGFQLGAESDVWRNPEDTRDWNSSPKAAGERRGTSDRFALKFVKPR
jgi:predicted methyltransferase